MTKHLLLQRLIGSNLEVDVPALEAVINQLWVLMELPQDGELIRLGGELGDKWSVDKGQIKATVTFIASEDNLLKVNRLEGNPVVVFGIEASRPDPAADTQEHPGQMKIEDVTLDEGMEAAADLAEEEAA